MQSLPVEPVKFSLQAAGEHGRETGTRVVEDGMGTANVDPASTLAQLDSRRTSRSSPRQAHGGQLTPESVSKYEGAGSESDTFPSSQKAEGDSQTLSHSMSSSIGYLSNRWNFGNSFTSTPGRSGEDSFR